MKDRTVKITLGFRDLKKEVELTLPDDEPTPWDLNDEHDVLGHRHQKVDAVEKVTGRAKYTHDMNPPGMLLGGFVRCPYAKADIKSVDLTPAENHPGVKAAISMAGGNVRYAGQPVAAIAAETREALAEAIALVKADYDVKPHAARLDMAMKEDAPQVHGNRKNVSMRPSRRNASVLESLRASHKVVEATCTTQVQTHCCLETHGSLASWEGDNLTVWTSTQATFGVRNQLARSLRIDSSQVRVISEFMGGGFGSKFMAGYWSIAAARLAKETGKPVKIMLDRQEEQTDTGNRPDSIQEMRLGITDDGKLGPYHIKKLGTPGISRRVGITNPMIYEFEETAADQGEVATNAGGQQAFRAPGHPQGSFGLEAIIDLAAEAAGVDPVEFRVRNDANPIRKVQYKEGAEGIGWSDRKPTGSATGRYRTGLGVAASRWGGMGGPRAEALCRIMPDGAVEVRSGAQDLGVGTRTLLAVITGEELGLDPAGIRTAIGDTNDPIGPGSGGSQTAASLSPAVRQAAYLAGRELLGLVAQHRKCEAKDLMFRKGSVLHTQKGKVLSFKEACRLIRQGEISATGKRMPTYGGRGAPPGTEGGTWRFDVGGVQFAKVTVDCDFGIVKVDKILALQDCGKIINRLTAEGQVFGGVIQGISYGLFEERHMDRHLGHMVNPDLEMYKIIGPVDMPEIEAVLYDVANGGNNCSVAGIGEPTMIPTAAAIAGAVHNAIGVRVNSLPLTPDRVLDALEEGGK